jgi:hypothetical protein
LGFTALATLIIPVVVMKMRIKPGKVRSLIDTTAFTDLPFVRTSQSRSVFALKSLTIHNRYCSSSDV